MRTCTYAYGLPPHVRMHVHMHVRMHVHMHVHAHICACTRTRACTHTRIRACICIRAGAQLALLRPCTRHRHPPHSRSAGLGGRASEPHRTSEDLPRRMRICTCAYARAYPCARVYPHMHTHAYTCTWTCTYAHAQVRILGGEVTRLPFFRGELERALQATVAQVRYMSYMSYM